MKFREFSEANRLRCERDFKESLGPDSEWDAVRWALAVNEEAGEIAGAVLGTVGKRSKKHKTVHDIGEEIADCFAYLDILAQRLGLDMGTIVAAKFNKVSERIGSDVLLPEGDA